MTPWAPGDWLAADRRLPVFANRDLTVASTVHSPRCVARAQPDGLTSASWCRCQSARQHILPRTALQVVLAHPDALLVSEQESGAFRIERSNLKKVLAPKPVRHSSRIKRRTPPPDYLLVEAALGNPGFKLPRRRRAITGGEVVFIRNEIGMDMVPWRLLAQTFVDDQPAILLLDASLCFEFALHPGWDQQRTLLLVRDSKPLKPNQLLIPAFPLPDGTLDPGWVDP